MRQHHLMNPHLMMEQTLKCQYCGEVYIGYNGRQHSCQSNILENDIRDYKQRNQKENNNVKPKMD